ncbi:hypothetical protein SUGI_0897700 [Cryptomeria japonica]|nr:hypothetical protein SUGI_0897700 [Cryptomeria japonica]
MANIFNLHNLHTCKFPGVPASNNIFYLFMTCKIQRRKCGDKCVLAPYFPPNDPEKFVAVHKIFRASKIVKTLQSIPNEKRADYVASVVYEANARMNDSIYGSAGAVCQLEKQISCLQSQLAAAKADLLNAQANLVSPVTGFHYGGEAGNTFLQNKDDLNFLQEDTAKL